jgi:predicted membrane protein (TIGR00267 family)
LITRTLITSSIALGISSGVSVYEAEILEGGRRIEEIEKAMIIKLEDTVHTDSINVNALVASIIVFLTPLVSCLIASAPFLVSRIGLIEVNYAAWGSILLSLATLGFVGTYMGRNGKGNPALKGIRMTLFGVLAFLIGFLLESYI